MAQAPSAAGQTKRALLIGINTYEHKGEKIARPGGSAAGAKRASRWDLPEWGNLDGSVNDVEEMHRLLASSKFGFPEQNIHVLTEGEAKQKDILAAMQKYLVDEPQQGDVVVFYYAGHGSQRFNSLNGKPDHLDETIVPADAATGTFDVRNKEIARLFNKAVDKGILLTAIFDSCHSGGVARGIPVGSPGKARFMLYDPRDAADPPDRDPSGRPVPRPEDRPGGALVLAAAQQDQLANEWIVDGVRHGAFTVALMDTLRLLPADATAEEVAGRIKVLMQGMGLNAQQAALDGPPDRRRASLFGKTAGSGKLRVAAGAQGVRSDGSLELNGGRELGLTPGCELKRINANASDPEVRVSIVSVGLGSSKAKLIAPATREQVEPGDEFELDKWVAPEFGRLQVWIPPVLAAAEITRVSGEISKLRESGKVTWVEDPVMQDADDSCRTNFLQWDGNSWALLRRKFMPGDDPGAPAGDPRRCPSGRDSQDLGKSPTVEAVMAQLAALGEKPRLALNLPPPGELAEQILTNTENGRAAIEVVPDARMAKYLLLGRVGARGGIEYAWGQKDVSVKAKGDCSPQSPYPPRSAWIPAGSLDDAGLKRVSAQLADYAGRLARAYSWLNLPTPTEGAEAPFPYRLVLHKLDSRGTLTREGPVVEDEEYGLMLEATRDISEFFKPKWVYVLSISCDASGRLLYPLSGQNNFQPKRKPEATEWPRLVDLTGSVDSFTIGEPFGLDSYLLLVSSTPLSDLSVFDFAGATRGGKRSGGSSDPLTRLLSGATAGGTRGNTPSVPTDWSVQLVQILSVQKGGSGKP